MMGYFRVVFYLVFEDVTMNVSIVNVEFVKRTFDFCYEDNRLAKGILYAGDVIYFSQIYQIKLSLEKLYALQYPLINFIVK